MEGAAEAGVSRCILLPPTTRPLLDSQLGGKGAVYLSRMAGWELEANSARNGVIGLLPNRSGSQQLLATFRSLSA